MLDDLYGWAAGLDARSVALEAVAIVACVLVAWLIAHRYRRDPGRERNVWISQRAVSGVLFPLLAVVLVMVARWLMSDVVTGSLLRLAVSVLASLLLVRVVARGLRAAFPDSSLVRALEKTLSWIVWGAMVLWVTGLLPGLLDEAEAVKWTIAGAPVSLRSLIEGLLSAAAVLVAMLWVSSLIEARLLRPGATNVSLRKIAANATRAVLIVLGVMLALTAAGIPVGALGVFGGALGVGIGLGLQKLASNYVSGFVILAERRLRIGDAVKVDGFEGHITNIATRYTVVRALDGRESIVPNEMLVTQRIENHSLADRNVLIAATMQVAYGTDLDALIPALENAIKAASPRIVVEPAPSVQLNELAREGLSLSINFWINDPDNGRGNVRSLVNLAVLRKLNELGIDIPMPQRRVHLRAVANGAGEKAATADLSATDAAKPEPPAPPPPSTKGPGWT